MARSRTNRGRRSVKRILDAAARLFGAEGFEGASMNAVARAAGVSKGLLHYHFRSKEHLLLEAQRATFRQIHARFKERVQRGEPGLQNAVESFDNLWESFRDMRAWAPFMVETMSLANVNDTARADLDAFYDESMGMLEDGISTVFAAELDQLAVSPEHLTRLVRVAFHGLIVELAYARNEADLAIVDELYLDMRELFRRVALSGPIHRDN